MVDGRPPVRPDEKGTATASFAALCRDFLAEEYTAHPVMASALGLTEFDGPLDDLSEAAFAERRRRSATWLERFRAMPDAELAADVRIDRELVVSILSGRAIMAEWQAWRRQPEIYVGLGLQGVFSLFLHRLRPEGALVRAAAQARAGARYVRELLPAEARDPTLRRTLAEAGAVAAAAFDVFASFLDDLRGRATGDFASR